MTKVVFLTDLTEARMDDTCARQLWYHKYEGGGGIIHRSDVIPSSILQESHDDLRAIAQMPDEDLTVDSLKTYVGDILSALTADDTHNLRAMEALYRRLGWFVSFALFQEPALRRQHDTIAVDPQILLDFDPLYVTMSAGRVLRSKESKEVFYRLYVPCPPASTRWRLSWNRHIQPQVELEAVEDAINEKLAYVQVVGLNMGYPSAAAAEPYLCHPYVRGWEHRETKMWTHNYLEGAKDGWTPAPVWNYPYGLVQWVSGCGVEVSNQQFPISTRILKNPPIIEAWKSHRLHREREIYSAKETCATNYHVRSIKFPQNPQVCAPPVGDACPFTSICWAQTPFTNPIVRGDFVARTSRTLASTSLTITGA